MRPSLPILLFAALAGGWLLRVSREPPPPTRSRPQPEARPEQPPLPFRDALLEEAKTLRAELAERIRQELQAGARDPQRRAVRMAWLWHQRGPESVVERTDHLLWFIRNEPVSEFLDWPPAWFGAGELGPARMEEILTAWKDAVRTHPDDPRVAWLAAKWFQRHDERHALEFLKASIRAQPDFAPAADALAEWCVRQIALQGASEQEARRLLATTMNPEIQKRAARRFHRLAESEENDPARRKAWRKEARQCFSRAREIQPSLREDDVFGAAGGALETPDRAPYSSPGLHAILNAGRRHLKRLPVDAFPDLPPAVAATLRQMGCTIPQADESPALPSPNNVIRGRFYDAERESWAVLCSVQDTVRLLVFRDAADTKPETLQGGLESDWMQTTGPDSAGFSWAITVADEAKIRWYHSQYGGAPLPPLDHDGIDSHFLEKASVVLYHHRGKWLRLQGAD
jgi:hypothetical protein